MHHKCASTVQTQQERAHPVTMHQSDMFPAAESMPDKTHSYK